jgi:hypothetical protein
VPSNSDDLAGARLLRLTLQAVALALVVGGSLFLVPRLARSLWPWPLAPFTMRFLGAVYLAELVGVILLLIVPRWGAARLLLPMAAAFIALVTAVSFLHLDRFDFQKWGTWAWFILYIAPLIVFAYHLPFYRRLPPAADTAPTPAPWRYYLRAQGIVLGLYGIGLFLAPATFGAFWPWEIDAFHGQMYGAVFISGAVGSFILARAAAPVEFAAAGIPQFALGLLAIVGLVIVNLSQRSVNWSLPGTWLWVAGFVALALAGLGMARHARATLPMIWERWKHTGRAIGDFQARVVLTFFYFVIVLPFGLGVRLLSDPLRLRRPAANSTWIARTTHDTDMEQARRQS